MSGDLSKNFSLTLTCNTCHKELDEENFESLKEGTYRRPMCKQCYNAKRRERHGGAKRDKIKREKKLISVYEQAETIEGCDVIECYTDVQKEHRVVLLYGGREWDTREYSFLTGTYPWKQAKNVLPKVGAFLYIFKNVEDDILYIGKSTCLAYRISQHFCPSTIKTNNAGWKRDVVSLEYAECQSEADMHVLEMYMINKIKPVFNGEGMAEDAISFELELPEFKKGWFYKEWGMQSSET